MEASININSDWKKNVVRFLISQTISLFGSSIVQYAILWYVTLATKSGVLLMVSTLCGFLPQLIVSLFAGVWADKYDKKKLIIYSDLLIAIATLILAIFFIAGYRELWLLFLVSGIRSFGYGVEMPAINAVIPQMVPPEKLMKVNSINDTIQSIIMLVSPAVSGVILAWISLEATFFLDVITAIIGIAIMIKVVIPYVKKPVEEGSNGIKDLLEGIKYINKNKSLKFYLIFYALLSFLIVPAALLTPLMVTRTFGSEVWKLTMNEMTFFAGSILGGIILTFWGGFKNKMKTIIFSSFMFGVLSTFLGMASIFWIYMFITFISGIFLPFLNASSITLLQEETKPELMGRVFGVEQIIGTAVMPLGMVFFGPIADVIKIETLLIIAGIGLIIMSVILQRYNSSVLNKRENKSILVTD